MTNYEKYADIINNFKGTGNFCKEFVEPYILKIPDCYDGGVHCGACRLRQAAWLFEEYEEPKEPETDWNNVEVDTPILVRVNEDVEWLQRYFAKYENGIVYAWDFGRTSWNETTMISWDYAKLAESEKDK